MLKFLELIIKRLSNYLFKKERVRQRDGGRRISKFCPGEKNENSVDIRKTNGR
jgi:hypothetical protein